MSAGTTPGSDEWLREHGIDPDVWEARGVLRYERGDRAIKERFEPWLKKGPRKTDDEVDPGTITKVVNQSSGLLIPKFAPPGFPPIPPQLRPDERVITNPLPTFHHHGPNGGEWPVYPAEAGKIAGRQLMPQHVLSPQQAQRHIERAHDGINVHVVHAHDPEGAKYVMLGPNKRIDLHPLAAELLPDAEVVFFVLEGALKNDAVLSAILRDGRRQSVISVPSVTLWDPRELRALEPLLRGKTVIVVPDSDWYENEQVDAQALYVRTELRLHLDLNAFIAAPAAAEGWDKVGVDDHLGVLGRSLDELQVRGREVPESVFDRSLVFGSTFLRSDVQLRDIRALHGLSLHANLDGRLYRPLGTFTRIMGLARNRREVVPAVLEQLGSAVTVYGSTKTRKYSYYDQTNRRGVTMLDWEERPTIEVRPEYRASDALASDLSERRASEQLELRVQLLEQREKTRTRQEVDNALHGLEDQLAAA
jgi:hypothetical protein